MMAASLAHEMRTPLATLKIQAKILGESLPELIAVYRKATNAGLASSNIDDFVLDHLGESARILEKEVLNANQAIDMLMALATSDYINEKDFQQFSMKECVELAVSRVPYKNDLKRTIYVEVKSDFIVLASKEFLIFVLINLINNSLDALRKSESGLIRITIVSDSAGNRIEFLDDGEGIDSDVLPHIFDRFFTTKNRGGNSGVGLAFCKNVMESFGGSISCESQQGKYTLFTLRFKSG
jgi:signal transduction histidine kinase